MLWITFSCCEEKPRWAPGAGLGHGWGHQGPALRLPSAQALRPVETP
jgi:hypothetical protein